MEVGYVRGMKYLGHTFYKTGCEHFIKPSNEADRLFFAPLFPFGGLIRGHHDLDEVPGFKHLLEHFLDALGDGLRFIELADLHGFAVCWPQGAEDGTGHNCWNVGYPFQTDYRIDDTAYLRRLVRHLQKNFGLSRRNVFLSGMSNGGEMCYKMAAEHPETFSAIASIAGLTLVSMSTDYRRPVPFMEVHGTDDKTSAWDGDPQNKGGWGAYLSVPSAVSHIVSANRCVALSTAEIPSEHKRVILHHFTEGIPSRKGGPSSEVLLYEVRGGDHSWSDRYIPTCDLVWEFFSRYVR